MRIASLDLGTNALLLTIAEWDGESLTSLYEDVNLIRLGQDLERSSKLHPEAKKRSLIALEDYLGKISNYRVEKIIAVGTEALRKADDSNEFIQNIWERLNVRFQIISGKEEATLTFKATQKEFSYLKKNLLMFDIGGGSTEIVVGNDQAITLLESLPLGTVRLTDQFVNHDPILKAEAIAADSYIRNILKQILVDDFTLAGIGIAGTVTTLKAVTLEMETYTHSIIHKSILKREEVSDLIEQFTSTTIAERVSLKGLPERRADIIPMGALITQAIMDIFHLPEIYVSDRGLRWGVLYDWIGQPNKNKN